MFRPCTKEGFSAPVAEKNPKLGRSWAWVTHSGSSAKGDMNRYIQIVSNQMSTKASVKSDSCS